MPCAARNMLALSVLLLLLTGGRAAAARLRVHYVVVDNCGTTAPQGEPERGRVCPARPRPNVVMTYRHPCSGGLVKVPLFLPEGTPVIQHRGNRLIYNYGSYT